MIFQRIPNDLPRAINCALSPSATAQAQVTPRTDRTVAIRQTQHGPKSWGNLRVVEVHRGPTGTGLGISIVGGKVETNLMGKSESADDSSNQSSDLYPAVDGIISGIFIKNVIANSPAGRTGQLFTGDHVVQVDDTKLTCSDQQLAAQAIQNAGNPVKFKIRSIRQQQVFNDI